MNRFRVIVLAMSFMFLGHVVEAQVGSNWTEVTSAAPWSGRSQFGAVVFNGQMWVLGGYTGSFLNDVWSTSDGTNWTEATPAAPWSARKGFGAVVFNGQMWVLGGINVNGTHFNDVWSTSDGTNWTEATPAAPWSARQLFGAVVFNGRMWVIGGDGGSGNDVWSSSDGANWTEATPAASWSPRYGLEAVVFNGQMWVLGGSGKNNDVWSSSDGTNWTEATPAASWSPRQLFGAVVFNGQMWVLGGDGSGPDSDVWSSSNGANWTEATPAAPWGSREWFPSVVFNNQMWVLGGSGNNDVWASPPLPPPMASFTAAPTNGFAPLSVTFTDTSTGPINNWFWSFGDGGTANLTTDSVVYTYETGGVYTVSETVTGPDGVSSNVQPNYIVVVNCPTITLSPNGADPTVLTGGTAGVAYSQTITASGGVGTYTYATTSSTLPPGLSLSSAGVLSGTNTIAGTYTFTVTATDTNGCRGSQAYTLTMTCPTIMISPSTLPFAMAGTYYSQAITAGGGNGPYTYAETGMLPNGIGLSSGGVLSGISTETGLFPISVTATDQVTGCTGSRSYTLRVDCPVITLSPTSLPAGTVGSAYSVEITPNGGVPSYAFLVSSGSLPTGLNLDPSAGVLSGTPTAAGTFTFGIEVYDANGCGGATSYTVQMNCPTITLSSPLPNGTVMVPYTQTVTASGGTAPYTFSVLDGTLPLGLSLSSAGTLSGTPTTSSNVTFTLLADDAYSCSGTQQYTVATFGTFEITAITRQSNDILVTWSCLGSHSYVLQSTKSTAMIAQYNTNFVDISPTIVASGLGPTTTNYLDAGAAYAPVLTAPTQVAPTSGVASTVNSSAQYTRGLTDSLGNPVTVGSVLMLGSFSITEATIQSNFTAGNVSAIMSNFTPYATAFAVGNGTGFPASWDVSQSAPGFGGQQIYLLAIDKPTLAAATHLGIFTAPSWVFPVGGGTNTIDLEDVSDFVIGTQGGSLTINLPLGGETYTFTDTARLSVLPGRILFYRVRLAQ